MRGRCTCSAVSYELTRSPLFVHCCHCRWCQRETGSAFVLNALIEAESMRVEGATTVIDTPSESGSGQRISRCTVCSVALWSVYSGAGPAIRFVRVGTLDNPAACAPDLHIYTESKLPWVVLPDDVPSVPQFYRLSEYWPEELLVRRAAALDQHGR